VIRDAVPEDVPFLSAMLCEAALWRSAALRPTPEEALADHRIARYIAAWGRHGDRAVVAEDETGHPIGAAWYRLFGASNPGYGFVDEAIPELTVAVVGAYRRQGVGTRLLEALIERCRGDEFGGISLSVEKDNPAVRLYRRLGFIVVGESADALTMLRAFDPSRGTPSREASSSA
jgi:ribosomal protein S18 acetylase RimI-like enzyme